MTASVENWLNEWERALTRETPDRANHLWGYALDRASRAAGRAIQSGHRNPTAWKWWAAWVRSADLRDWSASTARRTTGGAS